MSSLAAISKGKMYSASISNSNCESMPHRFLLRTGLPASVVSILCYTGNFLSNFGLGTTGGLGVVSAEEWAHPYAIFVGSSAIIQLIIMIIRMMFSERKDLLAAMRTMREDQATHYNLLMEQERGTHQAYRHALANHIHNLTLENELLRQGASPDSVPRARSIFPDEKLKDPY